MGALPKRKPSTRRQGKRRASLKANLPSVSLCPRCGTEKLAHFACPECGHYQSKKQNNESQKNDRPKTSKKAKSN